MPEICKANFDRDHQVKIVRFSGALFACVLGALGNACSVHAEKLDAAVAPSPTYGFTQADPVWQQVGSTDQWRAPAAAYDYDNELYELPVEGEKWVISGGFLSTTFKYYEYIDMQEARWGADDAFLYLSWETAGSRIYDSGFKDHGYLGHYYAYFGVPNGNDLVIEIPGGKADILGTTFSDVSGDLKVFEDAKDAVNSLEPGNDVPGPGGNVSDISSTMQGGDGFESEVSGAALQAKRIGDVVEVALDLSSVGLTPSDTQGLEYMYIGVAETNPSAVSVLFVNDHFEENVPTNTVEYDNVLLAVPEPSAIILALIATVCLALSLVVRKIFVRPAPTPLGSDSPSVLAMGTDAR